MHAINDALLKHNDASFQQALVAAINELLAQEAAVWEALQYERDLSAVAEAARAVERDRDAAPQRDLEWLGYQNDELRVQLEKYRKALQALVGE